MKIVIFGNFKVILMSWIIVRFLSLSVLAAQQFLNSMLKPIYVSLIKYCTVSLFIIDPGFIYLAVI
jgi:hypothetical protein